MSENNFEIMNTKISKEDILEQRRKIIVKVLESFNVSTKNELRRVLNREFICRRINLVTEHQIRKYFGTFTNFRNEVLDSVIETPVDEDDIFSRVEQDAPNFYGDETEVSEYDADELDTPAKYLEKKNYFFNGETGEYIFDFTRDPNIAKVITLSKERVYAIEQAYSNFDESPQTINDIALKQQIPPFVLRKILKALGLTHDSLPLTKEYLDEEPDDDKIISDLTAIRSFNIYEKFTHKKWKQTKECAYKWIQYEKGQYQPLLDAVKTLNFDVLPLEQLGISSLDKDNSHKSKLDYDSIYVVCLSDLHFGVGSDKDELFYSNKDIDITTTQEAVKAYLEKIKTDLEKRKVRPAQCVVMSIGDIIHSLSGKTSRGTPLECSVIGPKQFKYAFNTLLQFFSGLYELFPKNRIIVESCVGNHDGVGDSVLFFCLEAVLKDKIRFYSTMSRYLTFVLNGNSAFVLEHGDSYRFRLKKETSATRQSRVEGIFLSADQFKKKANKIQHRYYLTGHYHHFEYVENAMYDELLLPTINPADVYADTLGFKSTPAQISFILDANDGIVDIIRHKF